MAFLRDFDCEASHPAAGKGRARLDPDEFLDDGVNRIEPRETFLAMTRCAGGLGRERLGQPAEPQG